MSDYSFSLDVSHVSNKRFFYRVIGYLLACLALAQFATMAVSFMLHDKAFWSFLLSATVTAAAGITLLLRSGGAADLKKRYLFLLTTLCWLSVCCFAALPLYLSLPELSMTDAWFEAVSAITTTGSTVLSGLDTMPKAVLLWRAILQWIGGIGIIVMAIAILPALRIGGMKLFKTESSDISEKILPRSSHLSGSILMVYLLISAGAALGYYAGGMSWFDALTHAMTTAATGGFANYDASFGYFNDKPWLLWFSSVWMALAALPFVLFVGMGKGDKWALLRDPQVKAFIVIILVAAVLLALYQIAYTGRGWFSAITHSVFNVISVISTCGYASEDYSQ